MSIAKLQNSFAAADTSDPSTSGKLNRRLLVVAATLALCGILLLWLYIRRFEVETSGGERVHLLTVVSPVSRGTVLTDDMLGVREVPISYVESRAIKSAELSKVRGLRTSMDLDPQDTLQWSDLAIAVEDRDLSALIQPGNRALTIEARQNSMIRPGDYVDVLATFKSRTGQDYAAATVVLLQRVLVLAVGNETQRQALQTGNDSSRGPISGSRNLTLSLELDEAQMVALADQNAELSVAVRGGTDPGVVDGLPDLTTNNLLDQAARANSKRASRTNPTPLPVRVGPVGNP
jgi:pilus assembly protein CpaB